MSTQTQIVASVAARGYLDGWSDAQLAARQIAKLAEELAEAARHIDVTSPRLEVFFDQVRDMGKWGREVFDKPELWHSCEITDTQALQSEIADCAVVLSCLAHAAGIDAMQAGHAKSSADVARGVRCHQ